MTGRKININDKYMSSSKNLLRFLKRLKGNAFLLINEEQIGFFSKKGNVVIIETSSIYGNTIVQYTWNSYMKEVEKEVRQQIKDER